MRQPHRRLLGEALAQLPTDLLWAPALFQQLGDDTPQGVVGLDSPVTTSSATRTRATVRLKRPISRPAATSPVALEFPGDRRRRPSDLPGDLTDSDAFMVQISDLDPLLLGEISGADLTDLEPIQRLDEPDRLPVSVDGYPRVQLPAALRETPTSRAAPRMLHPGARSSMNRWRLAESGRRPGPFFRRRLDNTISKNQGSVATLA